MPRELLSLPEADRKLLSKEYVIESPPGGFAENALTQQAPISLAEEALVIGTLLIVMGGPLLLLGGRPVLDGVAEGFSAAFLSQGAPRTVIGSDGRQLWLLTLEGVDDVGPTLLEATQLLAGLGLRDALNLDGGSSTGLVMGGLHTVKGRGVVGAVHNGLGLVLRSAAAPLTRAGS
jgi:hypothetical protein